MRFWVFLISVFIVDNCWARQVKVIDGDSLFIGSREIRLSGIDAPEYRQECYDENDEPYPCGKMALLALKEMLKDDIDCKTIAVDKYHRDVAVCYVDGKNINRQMVAKGWAVAYERYTHHYDQAQKEAKRLKKGIWRGRFIKPELYRVLMKKDKKAFESKKN